MNLDLRTAHDRAAATYRAAYTAYRAGATARASLALYQAYQAYRAAFHGYYGQYPSGGPTGTTAYYRLAMA